MGEYIHRIWQALQIRSIYSFTYLSTYYVDIHAFELGYQHTIEPLSYICAVPVEWKLLSGKGECKELGIIISSHCAKDP